MSTSNQHIQKELAAFEELFKNAVKSNVPLLDRILKYVVKTKGKQLRPMFVILSAKLCGQVNDKTYRAASLVELLHTATLVHDDVVDEANQRRGYFSVYALWKNKASVLVGDYLLAKGLLLSLDNNDYNTLHIISEAVSSMSEGELLQLEKSRLLNITEDDYFKIIRNKTASLLASACAAGADSSTGDKDLIHKMKMFGEYTGIAFQIKDDLFDYGTDDVGKPTGNDIKEKKLTLPLIYTLRNIDSSKRKALKYLLKNSNRRKESVQYIIQEVEKSGGIEYAVKKMNEFKSKALAILEQFPPSEARESLESLVRYTTERNR